MFTSNATGEKTAEKNLTFSTKFVYTFFLVFLFFSQKLEKKFKKVGNLLGVAAVKSSTFGLTEVVLSLFLLPLASKKTLLHSF